MNKLTPFQMMMMAVFGIVAVVAMLIFGGIIPGYKAKRGSTARTVPIVLWGTLPQREMINVLSGVNQQGDGSFKIEYSERSPFSYEVEAADALASGGGPDFWIISQDMALKHQNKTVTIPFVMYPERSFLDTFADVSELLIDKNNGGIMGVPFLIDPIVLFWNKNLFSSAGLSRPPRDWNEFTEYAEVLTQKNEAGNIVQSGAALGEFSNINNAKEILSMLIMQAGNLIGERDVYGVPIFVLDKQDSAGNNATVSSSLFFNSYSNPNKKAYSWNKALPNDFDAFAKESLAMYFGYASEIKTIKERNPHLKFDIAEAPQIKDYKNRVFFGKLYFLAIMKNAGQAEKQASFAAMLNMSGRDFSPKFANILGMASSRRDILAERNEDAYLSLINKSAIASHAWLEPDARGTRQIFKDMIESISSGSLSAIDAVHVTAARLKQSLDKLSKE